jgi:hypothetical protein
MFRVKLGAIAPAWIVSAAAAAWAFRPKPHAATTPMIAPRVRKQSETLQNEGKALRHEGN